MAPITISKGRPAGADANANTGTTTDPTTKKSNPMPDTDLESIGRHCEFPYCGILDFLPFHCESCRHTYCLEHRSEIAHRCPKAGEWARRRQENNNNNNAGSKSTATPTPTIYNTEQCAHISCKTLVNTLSDPGVRCPDCKRLYCLRHRLQEGHDCVTLVAQRRKREQQQLGGQQAGETLRSMFAKVRTWGKEGSGHGHGHGDGDGKSAASISKSTAKTPATTATMTAQNRKKPTLPVLKKSAKGDPSIPADRRLYLHVVGCSDTNTNTQTQTQETEPPTGDTYFDTRWKVGRVLDEAAKRLRVENLNNRGGGDEVRLRVFHVESGVVLGFSESVGDRVKQGDTIVLVRGLTGV